MSQERIQSTAFRQAQLQSERLRIVGVLGFVSVFLMVTFGRVFVVRTVTASSDLTWVLVSVGLMFSYELWSLHRISRTLEEGNSLPPRFWILSTFIETSLPAFALAFLGDGRLAMPYRVIASPKILVFFIFIILSTLRLHTWISVLSGAVASISYLSAALYLGWRPPLPGLPAPVTQTGVTLNAITLLVGGVVAGAVASEIRKHVRAALREAETKRMLEAVQHDLRTARSIQQSLLPRDAPQVQGFDIAGWNLPADDTGGDYFDWKTFPDGKVVVSLADVTGHGIGPSLLASMCHAYARSSFSHEQSLPKALERINCELGADLTPGRFVTFAAAQCCPGCADIEVLSAGHGPIFIYSRSEDLFTEMITQGLPLGILPTFNFDPPARYQLQSGDMVLLATDGFFEWENDRGEQFGAERMQQVMRESRDFVPTEIISQLYESVTAFSNGTKQQDDLTAVIIKRV